MTMNTWINCEETLPTNSDPVEVTDRDKSAVSIASFHPMSGFSIKLSSKDSEINLDFLKRIQFWRPLTTTISKEIPRWNGYDSHLH